MAAALVGFPLAGFLGSFFAVPLVGFIHIVGREAVRYYRQDQQPQNGTGPNGETPKVASPPSTKTSA
jgi:predicted PurR-regulated permease PerM